MNEYACYSKYGLTDMIKSNNRRIAELEKEKNNIGNNWTQQQIDAHIKYNQEEIETFKIDNIEIEKELKSRK